MVRRVGRRFEAPADRLAVNGHRQLWDPREDWGMARCSRAQLGLCEIRRGRARPSVSADGDGHAFGFRQMSIRKSAKIGQTVYY